MALGGGALGLVGISYSDRLRVTGLSRRMANRTRLFRHIDLVKNRSGFWLARFSSASRARGIRANDRDSRDGW